MTQPDASIIIKRYANRKLYNTRDSQYITLAQIAQLIEAGELVQIVDKASGEDITEITLAQVFVDDRRKRPGAPPIEGLKDVFRNTSEQVRKQIAEPVSNIRQSFGDSVNRLLKSGEERASETRDSFQNWISEQTQVLEDTQRRFEDRLKVISTYVEDFRAVHEQLEQLQGQINRLAARLKKFEQGESTPSVDEDSELKG
ncbi:MAG: polyhydroxyalkanoate synthesis regulator DNA-binding domain-containing protein [Bradymonadia bacterium]